MKLPLSAKYPKTLEIKDEIYQIRIVKKIPNEDSRTMGLCDDGKKIIWIKSRQSKRGMFRTFIHELLHAIECEYSIKLKHKRIDILELALEALITDNL